ncbi:MAG: hypothetical protein WBO68_08400 [Pyrinomonadaceae bacterium]
MKKRSLQLRGDLRSTRKGVNSGVGIGVEDGGFSGTFRHLKFCCLWPMVIEAEKCVFNYLDHNDHSEHGYYHVHNAV